MTRREQELLSAAAITTFKLNGQFLALAEELARRTRTALLMVPV